MTEHERIILRAAANLMREHGVRLETRPWEGAHYIGRQFNHAADEIEYALRCYDDVMDSQLPPAEPQSLRVQP